MSSLRHSAILCVSALSSQNFWLRLSRAVFMGVHQWLIILIRRLILILFLVLRLFNRENEDEKEDEDETGGGFFQDSYRSPCWI